MHGMQVHGFPSVMNQGSQASLLLLPAAAGQPSLVISTMPMRMPLLLLLLPAAAAAAAAAAGQP